MNNISKIGVGFFLCLALLGCASETKVNYESDALKNEGLDNMYIWVKGETRKVNRLNVTTKSDGNVTLIMSNYSQNECDKRKKLDSPCGYSYGMKFSDIEGLKTLARTLKRKQFDSEFKLDTSFWAYSFTEFSTKSNSESSSGLNFLPHNKYVVISGSSYIRGGASDGAFVVDNNQSLALGNLLMKTIESL